LVKLVLQLTSLHRNSLEKFIYLIDVVTLEANFEGHRVDGVEG